MSAYWSDGSIPWLASGAVNQWEIKQPSEFITERGLRESAARWVPENAVVMGLAGQGRTKGMVARTAIRATCNQSLCAIIPDRSLEHRFLHFWLSVNHDNIRNLAGGDKRDGLNHEHVRSISIPLPPVRVQARIADYLDRETAEIDAMDAELDRLVEALRERQAANIESVMWTGSPRPVAMKLDCELVTSGSRGWATYYAEEGDRFLRIADMNRGSYGLKDASPQYVRIPEGAEGARSRTQSGDLLFSITAYLGSVGVVGPEHEGSYVSQHVALVRLSQRLWVPRFVAYAALSATGQRYLTETGYGGTKTQLNLDQIRDVPVPLVPLEEQRRIVAELDDQSAQIDDMIADAHRLKGLLAERRATLITDVVTGKKEVPA